MGTLLAAAIVQALLGTGLVAIGRWGVRAAGAVPAGLPDDERARRSKAYVRGGWVSVVVGLAILGFAVCTAVAAVSGVTPAPSAAAAGPAHQEATA